MSNISGMKFNKFSILNTTKLSVRDMKEKVKPLKDNRLLLGQDTSRPIKAEDILERVGLEGDSENEGEDILDGSNPQIERIDENKETESWDTQQNLDAEIGEDLWLKI